jgi:hypothetical protein
LATKKSKGRRSRADRDFIAFGKPLIDRLWVPSPKELADLEGDSRTAYDVTLVSRSLFDQRVVWRAVVRVPVYEIAHTLRMELEHFGQAVYVEDWTGDKLRHTYGGNRLCMWYPDDPPDRRWRKSDGLLKLIDTAVMHLFKEYYFRETGEWLGDEVHRPGPKTPGRDRSEGD